MDKPCPALLRQLLNGLGILREQFVVRGGVGEAEAGGAQVLVPDGTKQDEAHSGWSTRPECRARRPAGHTGGRGFRGRRAPSCTRRAAGCGTRVGCSTRSLRRCVFHDLIHQTGEFLFEPRRAHRLRAIAGGVGIEGGVAAFVGEFLEAGGHAVAEEDDRGLHQIELLAEPLPALGRRIEAGARHAERGVAGKAEIAHGKGAVGELLVHPRFQVAVSALALEQHVAEEKHPVAGEDLKGRLGGAGGGEGEEEEK